MSATHFNPIRFWRSKQSTEMNHFSNQFSCFMIKQNPVSECPSSQPGAPFPQMERTCKHSELSAESWGLLATEEGQIVPIGTSGEETRQLHAIFLRASWDTLKQGIKYIPFLKNLSSSFIFLCIYFSLPVKKKWYLNLLFVLFNCLHYFMNSYFIPSHPYSCGNWTSWNPYGISNINFCLEDITS